MRVMSVVGARPQLVKLAPVAAAMDSGGVDHLIVHTGQHYDADLSDVFFQGLGIPAPDIHLGIGSGSHGAQTGSMLAQLDPIIDEHRPDWVLVYGDTNSTVAAALAAVKLHVKVAHLEAGLRSFNRRMPEEHNRVLTDHAADLLLAPTEVAMGHLADENLASRSVLVGDVMVDVCLQVRDRVVAAGALPTGLPEGIDPAGPFLLCTLHRPDNTDDQARLESILDALATLEVPVALLAHPRLVAKAADFGISLSRGAISVGRPLPYAELVTAVLAAQGVVTDSGGLQKEAFLLDRVTTTIRPETEWVETLDNDWNVLLPDPGDLTPGEFARIALRPRPTAARGTPFGDGHAATRVVEVLQAQA
mgnify:CR=1 FL=1